MSVNRSLPKKSRGQFAKNGFRRAMNRSMANRATMEPEGAAALERSGRATELVTNAARALNYRQPPIHASAAAAMEELGPADADIAVLGEG
jgi:hypothetical protein